MSVVNIASAILAPTIVRLSQDPNYDPTFMRTIIRMFGLFLYLHFVFQGACYLLSPLRDPLRWLFQKFRRWCRKLWRKCRFLTVHFQEKG